MEMYPVYDEARDVWVACMVPMEELSPDRRGTTTLLWLVFGFLAVGLAVYAILLLGKKDAATGKYPLSTVKERRAVSRKRKLVILILFFCIVFFLCSLYLQTLYMMSMCADNSTALVARIEETLGANEAYMNAYRDYHEECQQALLDLLAWHLGQSPAHVSTQTLDLFSDILNMTGASGERTSSTWRSPRSAWTGRCSRCPRRRRRRPSPSCC